MSISVKFTSNTQSVVADMRAMADGVRDQATMRALNRTAEQVRTATSRAMRAAGYNLKASTIKAALRIRRASVGRLWASVIASGKPIPLIDYGARVTARGVSVSVLSGRRVITGAFIAKMRNGKVGVFVRDERSPKQKRTKANKYADLPIRELFGPSVPAGMANAKVHEALTRLIEERYPAILAREVRFLIDRVGRR